jgi:hypothetical protein
LPRLATASERFRARQVAFVAVSFDEDESAVNRLVKDLALPFQVVQDQRGALAGPLGMRSLSEMYLFGPAGEPLVHYRRCDPDAIADLVEKLTQLVRSDGGA